MNHNLLILGAGLCGLSAKETAEAMACFQKIAFLDDNLTTLPNGDTVLGKIDEFKNYISDYDYIFVAMANPDVKLNLLKTIKQTTPYKIATLISPRAYISPSAVVMPGSLVEPMATVNTGSVIEEGCIIGAGSVVNHYGRCCGGVHLECHATVADNAIVPYGTDVDSCTVYTAKQ